MTNDETIKVIEARCRQTSQMGFKLALWPLDGGFCWQWKHPNGLIGQVFSTDATQKGVALWLAAMNVH
jgi:hypothetical protein